VYLGGRAPLQEPVRLDPKIVNKTLDEAASCRRKGISITTFMVTDDHHLQQSVEKFTHHPRAGVFRGPREPGLVRAEGLRAQPAEARALKQAAAGGRF
jgi:hypothetical protein